MERNCQMRCEESARARRGGPAQAAGQGRHRPEPGSRELDPVYRFINTITQTYSVSVLVAGRFDIVKLCQVLVLVSLSMLSLSLSFTLAVC